LFYLEQHVCQRTALQARFRSRTSQKRIVAFTPSESTLRKAPPYLKPDIIVRLHNRISLAKIERYTLGIGLMGDVQGSGSYLAVAEYQERTSPRMRVRHFNIAGVAWSNFKPGINTNATAILNSSLSIDVVNVRAGVDEALVAL
jgi:hypothetical protein